MAISTLAPDVHAPIEDPVSFEEAALLFKETRLPEFDGSVRSLVTKLQRWAKEDQLQTERRGRPAFVSYSDLLESHARRYPDSGR